MGGEKLSGNYDPEGRRNGASRHSEGELRALALRLLSFRDAHDRSEAVEILIGEIPGQMPVDIPLPKDSHVAVSLVRKENDYKEFSIILDSHMPWQSIVEFYNERLH